MKKEKLQYYNKIYNKKILFIYFCFVDIYNSIILFVLYIIKYLFIYFFFKF